jgi:acetyl esterase/lipase
VLRGLIKTLTLSVIIFLFFERTVGAQSTVTVKSGIVYAPSGQKMDICIPSEVSKRTSLILIHGGGFTGGSRFDLSGHCKLFAEGGFVVSTIDYRLAPAYPYPSAIEDAKAAVEWNISNAKELGIDPKKIILLGYSAGGTIALSTGLAKDSQVAGIIDIAGITDFNFLINTTDIEKLAADVRAYLGNTTADVASPLSLVGQGDPAVFLFHGDADPLVPVSQAVRIAEKLKSKNVPLLLKILPGGGHDIFIAPPHIKSVLTDITNILLAYEKRM